MKNVFLTLGTSLVGFAAQASDVRICGQAGMAMFNSQNVFQCQMTTNTCQTQEFLNNEWFPSANGKCPTPLDAFTVCGMGGYEMQHPFSSDMVVGALSTCETRALSEMGWVRSGF